MTKAEIAAVKARAEAATKEPWILEDDSPSVYALTEYQGEHRYRRGVDLYPNGVNRFSLFVQGGGHPEAAPPEELRSNAEFIAAARADIPALIETVERLIEALRPFAKIHLQHAGVCHDVYRVAHQLLAELGETVELSEEEKLEASWT